MAKIVLTTLTAKQQVAHFVGLTREKQDKTLRIMLKNISQNVIVNNQPILTARQQLGQFARFATAHLGKGRRSESIYLASAIEAGTMVQEVMPSKEAPAVPA